MSTGTWKSRWAFEAKPLEPREPEEYIEERLNYEINEYTKRIAKVQSARFWLVVAILLLGGIGSLVAALSNMQQFQTSSLSIWVALSTAFAVAVSSWSELRELDWRVQRGAPPNGLR